MGGEDEGKLSATCLPAIGRSILVRILILSSKMGNRANEADHQRPRAPVVATKLQVAVYPRSSSSSNNNNIIIPVNL